MEARSTTGMIEMGMSAVRPWLVIIWSGRRDTHDVEVEALQRCHHDGGDGARRDGPHHNPYWRCETT